ncbi:MAG: hypothetical protein IMF12_05925 [Proteobacteria bacterium]|nr:hypothetical protein [Pseudomonadota bacterium]
MNSVAFSPDGSTLASVSYDKTIRLWDVSLQKPSGEPLTVLTKYVSNIVFSPDGNTIASSGSLWDVKQKKLIASLYGSTSSIAFSPDGNTLASGGKTLLLWDINSKSLLKKACYMANRNLSHIEWREYMGAKIENPWKLSHKEWHEYTGERPHEKTCPNLPKDTLGALQHIKQGEKLAKEGEIAAAVKEFKVAQKLDANYMIADPQIKAEKIFVFALVEQGQILAKDGKSSNVFDSRALSLRYIKDFLIKQKILLTSDKKIKEAIEKYQEAQLIDSNLKISSSAWSVLCKSELYGHTAKVMDACEKAVVLTPEHGGYRIDRGLARAFIGNIKGAIEDFQYFVERIDWEFEPNKQEVQAWIDVLRKGENPFIASILVKQGEELAKKGKITAAFNKYQEAQQMDSNLKFDPEIKAKKIFAPILVKQGQELVRERKFTAAFSKYQKAQQMDSRFNAKKLFASVLVSQGRTLAYQGKITAAIGKYQEAQQMNANLKISALTWRRLCWYGSLHGYFYGVMEYCEKAVELDSGSGYVRDARALARFLTGNIRGAIEDYEFAINHSNAGRKYKIRGWLNSIQKGENPFTEEVLEKLRNR